MEEFQSSNHQSYWRWKIKRLLPNPVFAGVIGFACFVVGVLFAGVSLNVAGCWPMALPSLLFFAGSFLAAVAVVTKHDQASTVEHSNNVQTRKPTFAIIVLLIGVYSWLLTVAMHVLGGVFFNGLDSLKYFLTLGIAIASTLYMKFHGQRVVRHHFGTEGGRNLELSAGQAIRVVVLVVSFGLYAVWLIG